MISANNITLRLGKKALFEDVNVKSDWRKRCRKIDLFKNFIRTA